MNLVGTPEELMLHSDICMMKIVDIHCTTHTGQAITLTSGGSGHYLSCRVYYHTKKYPYKYLDTGQKTGME